MTEEKKQEHIDTITCRCCGVKRVKTAHKVDKTGRTIWVNEFNQRWYGRKCPPCYEKYKVAYDAKYRLKLGQRPLGSVDTCHTCGDKYIVRLGSSKYCIKCARDVFTTRESKS